MKIQDGSGSGRFVKVDVANRLATRSIITPHSFATSFEYGQAFGTAAGPFAVTTTEHNLVYIKNTSPDVSFVFNEFYISCSTSTNKRNAIIRFYVGSTAPTANNTTSGFGSLNTTISVTPRLEAQIWNGTSTGMTIASRGGMAGVGYFAPGIQLVGIPAFILGPNQTILFTAQGEENISTAFTITGHFEID
jgi:hypothetical protein